MLKINSEKYTTQKATIKIIAVSICSDIDQKVKVLLNSELQARCINTQGNDYLGNEFDKELILTKDKEQKLWIKITIPKQFDKNNAQVEVILKEQDNCLVKHIVEVEIQDSVFNGNAYKESLNRVDWLNSTIGIDNNVPSPFIDITSDDKTINFLGKSLVLNSLGFPKSVKSFYGQDLVICEKATELLDSDIQFCIENQTFNNIEWACENIKSTYLFSAKNQSNQFEMVVNGKVEYDGYLKYTVKVIPKQNLTDEVKLIVSINKACTKYFLGLGKREPIFDGDINWKWNDQYNQDGFWVGNVNNGIKLRLKDENYVQPLVNIYYNHKPLVIPKCWDNDSRGGIVYENGQFIVYTGQVDFVKDSAVEYIFDMQLTPAKPIDFNKQFDYRYFQNLEDPNLAKAKDYGCNILNIHHGNDLYPYINYPFYEEDAIKDFTKKAHEKDVKVKLYYTIRELSVFLPEFKVFRDMGYEIFEPINEKVKTFAWQDEAKKWIGENIGYDVIPAWRQLLSGQKYKDTYDSAIITNGYSRLCNYYVQGLKYLIDELDIDGIYIDDVAYNRDTMKRVRKVLNTKNGLIDMHIWNHFVEPAGFNNSIYQYMELLPYLDRAWIGEGYEVYESPYYWLINMSGIPFGVMSEMMYDGNRWRGLLFGMTSRYGWHEDADPKPVWNIIDEYNLKDCRLIGFWNDENKVVLSNPNVYASTYVDNNNTYIALANWSDKEQECTINLCGEQDYNFIAPEIQGFQNQQIVNNNKVIIPAEQGLFLVVSHK